MLPGDTLHLHVSTAPAAAYRIEIYRLGWYGSMGGRLIDCLPSCTTSEQGAAQPRPSPDPVTGEVRAGWPLTDSIPTGTSWTSGYYAARLVPPTAASRRAFSSSSRRRPPTARRSSSSPRSTRGRRTTPGAARASTTSRSDGSVPANHVSFDRPWGRAPEGQFFAWGIHLVRFLEREGYDVSYTTDVDIDRDPDELLEHRLVIVNGHDEYWTKAMRDAYEAARDAGVNLAFMGANDAYWQIRYENDHRTIVAYKSKADPVADRSQTTVQFRASILRATSAPSSAYSTRARSNARATSRVTTPSRRTRSATVGSRGRTSPRRAHSRASSGLSGIRSCRPRPPGRAGSRA